ncbi:MAG TPA: hypothetical protein VEN78_28285 [Bradyrhizobium sp.]|nr:hypothetical protein [Bradyrhizobium sp.]
MSREVFQDNCFFCGKPARYTKTDAENCRFYVCDNPECGEIEISWRAMERLQDNKGRKAQISAVAKEARRRSQIVRVILDSPTGELKVSVVNRSNAKD